MRLKLSPPSSLGPTVPPVDPPLLRMESHEVRAPQLWRRPHAKIYSYNQDFSANYYSVETPPPHTTLYTPFVAHAGLRQGQGQTGNLLWQTLREDPVTGGFWAGDEEAWGEVGRVNMSAVRYWLLIIEMTAFPPLLTWILSWWDLSVNRSRKRTWTQVSSTDSYQTCDWVVQFTPRTRSCEAARTTPTSTPSWPPPCWGITTSRSSTSSRLEDPYMPRFNICKMFICWERGQIYEQKKLGECVVDTPNNKF